MQDLTRFDNRIIGDQRASSRGSPASAIAGSSPQEALCTTGHRDRRAFRTGRDGMT